MSNQIPHFQFQNSSDEEDERNDVIGDEEDDDSRRATRAFGDTVTALRRSSPSNLSQNHTHADNGALVNDDLVTRPTSKAVSDLSSTSPLKEMSSSKSAHSKATSRRSSSTKPGRTSRTRKLSYTTHHN